MNWQIFSAAGVVSFLRCSNGAVVGNWEDILLMIGPKKDWIKYPFTPFELNLFNNCHILKVAFGITVIEILCGLVKAESFYNVCCIYMERM